MSEFYGPADSQGDVTVAGEHNDHVATIMIALQGALTVGARDGARADAWPDRHGNDFMIPLATLFPDVMTYFPPSRLPTGQQTK